MNPTSLMVRRLGVGARRSFRQVCCIRWACLALVCLCCVGRAQQIQTAGDSASTADAALHDTHILTTGNAPADLDSTKIRIGRGDLLEVSVFEVPELTQVVRISDNGNAEIALLGAVHLAGLSTADAQSLIETRLRAGGFLLNPHVSLLIREYGTQGISVLGEVNKPGIYPALGAHNLLDIISVAGGTTRFAARYACIKRRLGEETIQAYLSNEPDELLATNVELEPGDTVIVPKAGIVYVIGDVGRPGGFLMQANGKMTLLQAIALAAGINRTAASGNTRVIRRTDAGGFTESTIDLRRLLKGKSADVPLRPEDIVYVPPSTPKSILARAPALAQSAAAAAVYEAVP